MELTFDEYFKEHERQWELKHGHACNFKIIRGDGDGYFNRYCRCGKKKRKYQNVSLEKRGVVVSFKRFRKSEE